MEDLFCIKYLEKERSLNPLVITKCHGMVSFLLDSSIKMTCPLIWHTSPFCFGLPHFVQVVYIISSNSFYFPLPENSFQNALLQIIYVNLKITVAPTMVTINVPSGSCYSVNITQGIWLHKSRQAASQVQISLTCFQNHLFTLHGSLGSYLEMRETGWIEKEKISNDWQNQTLKKPALHSHQDSLSIYACLFYFFVALFYMNCFVSSLNTESPLKASPNA